MVSKYYGVAIASVQSNQSYIQLFLSLYKCALALGHKRRYFEECLLAGAIDFHGVFCFLLFDSFSYVQMACQVPHTSLFQTVCTPVMWVGTSFFG